MAFLAIEWHQVENNIFNQLLGATTKWCMAKEDLITIAQTQTQTCFKVIDGKWKVSIKIDQEIATEHESIIYRCFVYHSMLHLRFTT